MATTQTRTMSESTHHVHEVGVGGAARGRRGGRWSGGGGGARGGDGVGRGRRRRRLARVAACTPTSEVRARGGGVGEMVSGNPTRCRCQVRRRRRQHHVEAKGGGGATYSPRRRAAAASTLSAVKEAEKAATITLIYTAQKSVSAAPKPWMPARRDGGAVVDGAHAASALLLGIACGRRVERCEWRRARWRAAAASNPHRMRSAEAHSPPTSRDGDSPSMARGEQHARLRAARLLKALAASSLIKPSSPCHPGRRSRAAG